MTFGVLLASGAALALPSETPDNTLMVNGRVRAIEQVGDHLWVGGNFTQVKERDGTVVANVSNVAVFNLTKDGTDQYVDIAPRLGAGSTTTNVRDIAVYGDDVVIGGDFPGPTTRQKNLVVADGGTGRVVRWFDSGRLQSVLAAPDLGRVYGGGSGLSAFDFSSGQTLWTRAKTAVDQSIHSHNPAPGYRDLELDADGRTIWAACACDDVSVSPSKALGLIKLDTGGDHASRWVADVGGKGVVGISVTQTKGNLYLGAGGPDFVAAFSKADGGRVWRMDTSGSTQVVERMDGKLAVGGHFVEVADEPGDGCGFRSSDPKTLDPNDECERRDGLAVYSLDGRLDPNWDPPLTGKYDLAWALHPEGTSRGTRLHVGGSFTRVGGITQSYYARLS